MEVSLVKNVITVTQRTDVFELDFERLLKRIIEDWNNTDIEHLTEEEREDIICALDCNFEELLSEMFNIALYKMEYEDQEGYDVGINSEMLEEIKNKFADYVYNR